MICLSRYDQIISYDCCRIKLPWEVCMRRKLIVSLICLFISCIFTTFTYAQGYQYVKAAPSAPPTSTSSSDFVDIPDLELSFFQYYPGNVCISFSAESYTSGSERMFVRALVDGSPASPSDVVFVVGSSYAGTRTFNFTTNLDGGLHKVTMQYMIDGGGFAYMADRTVTVTTAPNHVNTIAAPSGPDVTTTSVGWEDIPDMTYNLDIPKNGSVAIAFTGEAETLNNARMFLRALLDDQPMSPTDVVLATGAFTGVHAFSFTGQIAAGTHVLKLQWLVDAGGTAALGDRTMTISFMPSKGVQDGLCSIVSVSAPSGTLLTTTDWNFTDMPDMSTDIRVVENSTLSAQLTAEIFTTQPKPCWLRAVIDGQVANPTDVLFNQSGYIGTCSFNFVFKNLTGGKHRIGFQWATDAGGTASIGDRNMTLLTFPSPCPDMTEPFDGIKPVWGDNPLLVICWDPHRPEHPAPEIEAIKNLIFGSHPSVRDYYIVNSNNRFFVNDVGIKGWYDADKPADHYWSPSDPTDADGDGWISGHVEKWAEAINKADASFDFSVYDKNGDGNLTPDELGILIVIPQNNIFSTTNIALSRQYPTEQPLIVDGVTITWISEAYIGMPPNLGLVVYELNHLLLGLPDLYFWFFQPYAAGAYSIMDANYWNNHIDPFSKIRLGWIQPAIVKTTGTVPIDAVEKSHVAYVLHDPANGNKEYYIVENRIPSELAYDSHLPDQGLAVWHIMEDPDVYRNLPAPGGVDPTDWAAINPDDWGRRAIRMIRPVYGPPFDNALALWDGSDPITGYDLLSSDPDPTHATLTWHDGTPSGFAIKDISAASPNMTALIEVPGMPSGVEETKDAGIARPMECLLKQNYPNPFNAGTTIPFKITMNSQVTIRIYNLIGEEVAILLSKSMPAGEHLVMWNGMDRTGHAAPSGVYFCRIEAGQWKQVSKMIIIR
jgi:M6 family metalloprotease-like protein